MVKECNGYHAFLEYLNSLPDDAKKPIPCPLLRILPEDVLSREHYPYRARSSKYKKGSLMCIKCTEIDTAPGEQNLCTILSLVEINEKGQLELKCQNGNILRLRLEDFAYL